MSVNKDQARMLTALALACRPVGAPKWDDNGTYAAISRVKDWPLAMAIENVIRHAADSKARNPGVIGSKHTPAELGTPNAGPPRKHEVCRKHPAQRAESCPWCVHGVKAWDELDGTPPAPATRSGPDAARAALRGAERATATEGERDA